MLDFYAYKKCSTCRKAEAYLKKHDIPYQYTEITENPPSIAKLKEIYRLSGLPLKKLLNTSGQVYREMGLKDRVDSMSEDEIISLLSDNGKLIKRPVAVSKTSATVGFREDEYGKIWV